VKKEVFWSHHGPVLKWHEGRAYAVKSSNLNEFRFLEQWNRMGKTRNLDEFRRVLDMQALPMFNICYADKEGNVFYLFNGRFPDRPAGYDWNGVVPGNTSATEWSWVLPQSRLPSLLNPPGGYVQNCNSAPWYTNLQQLIDRRKYPPELCPNVNDLRQQLSLELIESEKQWTLDKVMKAKYNTRLLLADRVKADLIKLARGQTVDGVNLDEAADVLTDWDNTVSRDSKGSLLFVNFWRKYRDKTKTPFAVLWDEKKPAATPLGIGDVDAARAALAAAVQEQKKKLGKLAVPWGDVCRLRRGDLDVPIGGLTGDFGAFRIIGYQEDKAGRMIAGGGDSYVFAVEFTSPPTAYSILAYSQSEDPKSPHYNDQSKLFAEEKWKRAWFTEEEVAKNTKRSYRP
jgi:acyl-homoserine-lactone acylase